MRPSYRTLLTCGLALVVLIALLPGTVRAAPALTVTVTTTSLLVDGNTSSIACPDRRPGR